MQGVPARFSFLELSLVAGRNDLYSLHYVTSSDLPTPYLTKFSLPPDRFLAKTSSLSIAKRYTHPKQVESSSRLTPAVSELCQVLAHLPNAHRMHVLVHTAHAAKFNTIIARFNPDFQASQIEVTSIGPDTAIRLSEYIERGDLVAIAGDRTAIGSESSLVAPFLGHEAPFPVGPFILSMLLHCPVWSMISTRDPQRKARYKVTFQRLATPDHIPRTKRQEHLQNVVNAWANELVRTYTGKSVRLV